MLLTSEYLRSCEDLIGQSKTAEVIVRLMAVKDETAYKSEILSLSSRWKLLDRDTMTGTRSDNERTLEYSRINKHLLTLITAMQRELAGEKPEKDLFGQHQHTATTYRPLWQTYVPIILTGLAVWAISYFAYLPVPPDCHQAYDLNGSWSLFVQDSTGADLQVGEAVIQQDSCMNFFQMSGQILSSEASQRMVDFSSRVAGLNDGEIIFVYENFNGEMGVCRGVEPSKPEKGFFVSCTDLVGRDRNNQPYLELWLRPSSVD